MDKLFSLGLVIGIDIFGIATTQAMPPAPLEPAQARLTIPIAGGCGAGWHRGFDGICRPNVAPGVVVVPGAVVTPGRCGGRGTHRVCNPYRCWRVCN